MSDVYEGPVCLGKEWGSGHIDEGRHQVYPTEYIYKYFLTGGKIVWSCRSRLEGLLEGPRRSRILPAVAGHDPPGGRLLCLVPFCFYIDF